MKVLITGGRGQLARAFQEYGAAKGWSILALGKEELDIGDYFQVEKIVADYKPEVIINCAAYNLVDKAEEDLLGASRVNTIGPYNLALVAQKVGSFLIHFSTDYVFDGQKADLYHESDLPRPINKYGLTKYLGEQNVLKVGGECLVLRVSWLFGPGKQNFLAKLLTWAKKQEVLKIAYDEFSVPTYVKTVAQVAWKAYEKGLQGLFHLTSQGYCSRLEWAKYFFAQAGIRRKVVPVPASSFALPAPRPFFSAMSPQKIEEALGITLPSWQEEVHRYCQDMETEIAKW